jgi:HSP20 family protein
MLLQRSIESNFFNSLKDMQRLQEQLNRLFSSSPQASEFPALNLWVSANDAVVRAEVPGVDPDQLELSIVNDTLTLRGARSLETSTLQESCQRQERGGGQFTRTVRLPFNIESQQVSAKCTNGILEIKLPRAEADKPRRINVVSQ